MNKTATFVRQLEKREATPIYKGSDILTQPREQSLYRLDPPYDGATFVIASSLLFPDYREGMYRPAWFAPEIALIRSDSEGYLGAVDVILIIDGNDAHALFDSIGYTLVTGGE